MAALRVAVVGLGVISRFYLRAAEALDSFALAAICDVRPEALAPFRARVACYDDHRAMLAAAPLDAVIVTVPNDVHATVCRDALTAGVAVCVEKPLATTLADGRALNELASDRGVTLFTAFHRRYNTHVLDLLRALPDRPPVESVTVRYFERIEDHVGEDRWYLDPARCGGGCVADNGPNAFDLARLFAGELQVREAVVTRDCQRIDRRARIDLCSRAGVPARVELDWSFPGERKEVELRFAGGDVHVADMLAGYEGFKSSLWHEYAGILEDFSHAVCERRRDAGGLAALALVDAVYRAEHDGERAAS